MVRVAQDATKRIGVSEREYAAAQEALTAAKVLVGRARDAADKLQGSLSDKEGDMKELQKKLTALVRVMLACLCAWVTSVLNRSFCC